MCIMKATDRKWIGLKLKKNALKDEYFHFESCTIWTFVHSVSNTGVIRAVSRQTKRSSEHWFGKMFSNKCCDGNTCANIKVRFHVNETCFVHCLAQCFRWSMETHFRKIVSRANNYVRVTFRWNCSLLSEHGSIFL